MADSVNQVPEFLIESPQENPWNGVVQHQLAEPIGTPIQASASFPTTQISNLNDKTLDGNESPSRAEIIGRHQASS